MKRKRIFTILVLVLLTCALSTTAFAMEWGKCSSRQVPVCHWVSQSESEDR